VAPLAQADDLQELPHPPPDLARGELGDHQGKADVLRHGLARQELEILKDHTDLAPQVRHFGGLHPHQIIAVDHDPPGGGALLAIEEAHQGGFTGAAGADEKDKLPTVDLQVDIRQSDRGRRIELGHTRQTDD